MERQHGWFADVPPTEWPGYESDASDESYDEAYTEGITAFFDLSLTINRPTLWVDVGGGASDRASLYMEEQYAPWLRFRVVDPYQRSPKHNADVQRETEANGGADIVSSMSVVNILESEALIRHHLELLHRILKPGGHAIFKVWDGRRPASNRRNYHSPSVRHMTVFQRNQTAAFFAPFVQEVFGNAEVRDEVCILAQKRPHMG